MIKHLLDSAASNNSQTVCAAGGEPSKLTSRASPLRVTTATKQNRHTYTSALRRGRRRPASLLQLTHLHVQPRQRTTRMGHLLWNLVLLPCVAKRLNRVQLLFMTCWPVISQTCLS